MSNVLKKEGGSGFPSIVSNLSLFVSDAGCLQGSLNWFLVEKNVHNVQIRAYLLCSHICKVKCVLLNKIVKSD